VADLEIELSSPGSEGAPSPTSSTGVSGERPDQFPPPLLWAELGHLLPAGSTVLPQAVASGSASGVGGGNGEGRQRGRTGAGLVLTGTAGGGNG
jgi:hypothetical protein